MAAGGGVDASVRFLAAVALKNAANRHWRPRRDASTCVPSASLRLALLLVIAVLLPSRPQR